MSKSREEIVCTFFANLTQANYDKAKDFMVIFKLVVLASSMRVICFSGEAAFSVFK